MSNEIVLTENKIIQLYQDYREMAQAASADLTHESDLRAAFLAPAMSLRDPDRFEATFDRIIHHLDEALRKADTEETRELIHRTAVQLIDAHVDLLQQRIDHIKRENDKQWLAKLRDSFRDMMTTSATQIATGIGLGAAILSLVPHAADLMAAYFNKLLTEWKMKEREDYFYLQVGNIYQKFLNSRCLTWEYPLLQNTFSRNKVSVLPVVARNKGLAAALNLTEYDRQENELQDSARIISRTLMDDRQWGSVIDFMSVTKIRQLANFPEIRRAAVDAHRQSTAPRRRYTLWACGPIVYLTGILVACAFVSTLIPALSDLHSGLPWWFLIPGALLVGVVLRDATAYARSKYQHRVFRLRLERL